MGYERTLRVRPNGMTVGRWMILAAVVAVVLASMRIRTLMREEALWIASGILTLCAARVLVLMLYARRCPVCERGPVSRVAVVPFGDHYFRCSACGLRTKRFWLGRLWDASGMRDDRYYHRERPVVTWSNMTIEPRPDRPETATVGSLLREKLDRIADAPEPVVLDLPMSDNSPEPSPTRSTLVGVKKNVAERFFGTLETIRWSRNSRH